MKLIVFSLNYAEYSTRYAAAMARKGEVLLILEKNDAGFIDVEKISGNVNLKILYIRKKIKKNPMLAICDMVIVAIEMFKFKANACHFQEIPDPITPLFIFFSKYFLIKKVVLTVHDPLPHSGRDSKVSQFVAKLRNVSRDTADAILVHGKFCRDKIVANFPNLAKRVIVTQHGILMSPSAQVRPQYGNMLFFGRMEEYKGLSVLIEAIKILNNNSIYYNFVVAGRGESLSRHMDELQALQNVSLHDRRISNEEAERMMQEACVFLMPYLDATQSGVTAAAFANHRPVIASNVGGLPDIIIDGVNGLLVEPGAPVALANAIDRFMKDRSLQLALSEGAINSCNTELSWNLIVDHLYDDLVSNNLLP